MYKLIAIDMDDTLLCEDLTISDENYRALERAHKEGIKIVICTGRPYVSTKLHAGKLAFLNEEDAFVSFNGGMITTFSGEELFNECVSKEIISDLVDIARSFDINLQFYSKEDILVEKFTDLTTKYEYLSGMKAKVVEDLKTVPYTVKALYNCNDLDILEKIKAIISEKYSEDMNIFYSKPTYLEILSIKANKGLAIEHLTEKYGFKPEEVIAIGDSFNDISMIEYAGLGVAIANARDAVKEVADYTSMMDHNNSGVAEVINKFVFKD